MVSFVSSSQQQSLEGRRKSRRRRRLASKMLTVTFVVVFSMSTMSAAVFLLLPFALVINAFNPHHSRSILSSRRTLLHDTFQSDAVLANFDEVGDTSKDRSQMMTQHDNHNDENEQELLPPVNAAVIVPGFMMGAAEFQPLADALTARGIPSVVVPFPSWHWLPVLGGRSVRPLLERVECTVRHLAAAEGDISKVPMDLFESYSANDCWEDFQTTPGGALKVGGTSNPVEYPVVTPKGSFPAAGGPKSRVILIGHSAGGLVSRIFLSKRNYGGKVYGGCDLVHTIVTLGTPQGNAPGPAFKGVEWCNREHLPETVRGLAVGGRGFRGDSSGGIVKENYAFCCCNSTTGIDYDGDGVVPIASMLAFPGADKMVFDDCHHYSWTDAFGGNLPDLSRMYRENPRWYGSDDVLDKWVDWIKKGNEEDDSEIFVTEDEVRDMVDLRERKKALSKCGLYSSISGKEYKSAFETLLRSMEPVSYSAGTKLFSQNDESDALYIVREGNLECYSEATTNQNGDITKNETVVSVVSTWGVVGELGLLLDEPRALSVRVASSGSAFLFKVSRDNIKQLIMSTDSEIDSAREKYRDYFDFRKKASVLSNCPIFQDFSNDELQTVSQAMVPREVKKGETLIREGDVGETMYFVEQGTFACLREGTSKEALDVVKICKRNDYFGELGAVFGKPRQVSVRAMTDAIVWELNRDAFLETYRQKSSVVPLGNALMKQPWARKFVPSSVTRAFRDPLFKLNSFFSFIRLLDMHFSSKHRSGSKVHLVNSLLCLTCPTYFFLRSQSAGSILCKAVMSATFLALIYDNMVMALGKYIGEGKILKKLSKARSVLHGLTIPMLFLPLVQSTSSVGLLTVNTTRILYSLIGIFATHEFIDWLRFDSEKMILVDNRDSVSSSVRQMAGTLMYSSGKVLKSVLPVVAVQLSLLILGPVLWRRGAVGGLYMFLSGSLCLFTCSLQRPGIQALGETGMMGLLWLALAS